MEQGRDPDRLNAFAARLAQVRAKHQPQAKPAENHYSLAQHGWRMVIELVSGLLIGFAIGFGLDTLLGSTPLLMVIFTLLGFAAGIKTMIRTAAELSKEAQHSGAEDGPKAQ